MVSAGFILRATGYPLDGNAYPFPCTGTRTRGRYRQEQVHDRPGTALDAVKEASTAESLLHQSSARTE